MEKQRSAPSPDWSDSSRGDRRIVFVGYGIEAERIGPALGNRAADIIVIESDAGQAARARTAGYRVVEGSATDAAVLRQAHVDQAEIVAMTSPDLDEAEVHAIRKVRTVGMILTNLPKGYGSPDHSDTASVMMRRILKILDHSRLA
jgi:voltage-gated potassium channel Kch